MYAKLFPVSKLEVLFRKYIASNLLSFTNESNPKKIVAYLNAFGAYKSFFYIPREMKRMHEIMVYIKDLLKIIVNKNWDVALVTFLNYINNSVIVGDTLRNLIAYSYEKAIENGNLSMVTLLYEKFDNFRDWLIELAIYYHKYDILKYLLSVPDFRKKSNIDRAHIIVGILEERMPYNQDLIDYLQKILPPGFEDVFTTQIVSQMIWNKMPINKIEEVLDTLRPAIIANPTILQKLMKNALLSKNSEAVNLLINTGTNVNNLDIIMIAIQSKSPDLVRIIMDHGADPSINIVGVLYVLAEVMEYKDDALFHELFYLLTRNLNIHMDNDVIYRKLVQYEPGLLMELLKREPEYTDIDLILLQLINARIRDITDDKRYFNKDIYESLMSKLAHLKQYILSRTASKEESEDESNAESGEESEDSGTE